MKKILLHLSLLATPTFALAGGFDGFSVHGGIGYGHNEVNVRTEPGAGPVHDESDNVFAGQLGGSYSQSFGQFNLAASVDDIISNRKAGNGTHTATDVGMSDSVDIKYKLKGTWTLSVEPGWNFSDNLLGYAKLSYARTRLTGNFHDFGFDAGGPFDDVGSVGKKLRGFGYGAGVKYKCSENLFAYAEVQKIDFKREDIANAGNIRWKPEMFNAFVGVGYKF